MINRNLFSMMTSTLRRHFGSINNFNQASSEFSGTTNPRVLDIIRVKAGLDLTGIKRREGQRSWKTLSRDGRL